MEASSDEEQSVHDQLSTFDYYCYYDYYYYHYYYYHYYYYHYYYHYYYYYYYYHYYYYYYYLVGERHAHADDAAAVVVVEGDALGA